MLKKIIAIIVFIVSFISIFYLFSIDRDDYQASLLPIKPNEQEWLKDVSTEEVNNLVYQIYLSSKNGMIPDFDFVAGKSSVDDVKEIFGEPEQIDHTSVGDYAIYQSQQLHIGYRSNIVYDLRSYDDSLERIHYADIINALGDPDQINYYEDLEVDQIILVYKVNDKYQLKWILDKPDQHEQNPVVHHYSIVTLSLSEQNQKDPLAISEVIENMSIEEKLGQLIFAGISGTELNLENEQLLTKYKVGGIILNKKNIINSEQTITLINALKDANKGQIPLFFGIDQEGGKVSKLPGEIIDTPTSFEIGALGDPSFAYELGRVYGKLVNAYGFNLNFSPVLDININPENPVIGDRSFGADAEIVSKMGIQMMKGLQSENVITTIKHFPGHGDTSIDSHLQLPQVNKTIDQLEELEIVPFKAAIDEGADIVMLAHILLPKIDPEYPATMSTKIITEILRNRLDFDQVIITDDLTMGAIVNNFDIGRAAVKSIKAGSDIVMVAHEYEQVVNVYSALESAFSKGEISEDRINESVKRVINLKLKYGLRDLPTEAVNTNELNQLIDSVLTTYME